MLYWDYWSSFWKTWADIAAGSEASPSSGENATPSEDKYGYLTEYGTQILCLFSQECGCTYLSPNFGTITGHKTAACMGRDFYALVHPDFHQRLNEYLVSGKPHLLRCRLKHADGNWYWYLLRIHPKRGGYVGEYVCIIENIHETIQIQNTLQKAKLEAELALRARSEFLANMSHDLRTPLNAVIGFSQIIESEIFGKVQSPQYMEYVKHIQESGYDLLSRIEDLLEISNIDSGRVVLEREEVYLGDILKHVIGAQMHHASPGNITIHYQPREGDVLLHIDRLKLQHILGHLLSNAIRFSHQDGTVTIEAAVTPEEQLELIVRDHGSGMPKARLNDIRAALKEDNGWIAKNNGAIGLGLALTQEFVTMHGGTVSIESKPGAGTAVRIALPADCVRAATRKEPNFLRQATH